MPDPLNTLPILVAQKNKNETEATEGRRAAGKSLQSFMRVLEARL